MEKSKKTARRQSRDLRGQRHSLSSSAAAAFALDPSVDASQLYKLVGADLPESDRLRQVILWSLERRRARAASSSSASSPHSAAVAATLRGVMERLREKRVPVIVSPGSLSVGRGPAKPNERNVALERSIAELEKQHERVLKESETWATLRARSSALCQTVQASLDVPPPSADAIPDFVTPAHRRLIESVMPKGTAASSADGRKKNQKQQQQQQKLSIATQIHQLEHFVDNAMRLREVRFPSFMLVKSSLLTHYCLNRPLRRTM